MTKKLILLIMSILCIVVSGCGNDDDKYLGVTPEEFMKVYNDKLDSYEQNYEKYKISSIEKPDNSDIGDFTFNNPLSITGNYTKAEDSQNIRQVGFLVAIYNDDMKQNIFNALAEAAIQKKNVKDIKKIVSDLYAKKDEAHVVENGIFFGITFSDKNKDVDFQICDEEYSKSF